MSGMKKGLVGPVILLVLIGVVVSWAGAEIPQRIHLVRLLSPADRYKDMQ